MAKAKKEHYVDNEKFFQAMCEWKKEVIEADDLGESRPPVSEYIGECFMKIAEHCRQGSSSTTNIEKRWSVMVLKIMMYAHNFDPEKSRIHFHTSSNDLLCVSTQDPKEKSDVCEVQVREQSEFYKHFPMGDDKTLKQQFNLTETDIENFAKSKKKKEKKQEDSSGTLDEFFGE